MSPEPGGMDMATVWDRQADAWAEWEEDFEAANVALDGALLETAAVKSGTRVLDVACGLGGLARAAQERGADVTAADISPRMIELATERCKDIELRVADADAALEGGPWDAIVSRFGVFFFDEPAGWLQRAHDALAPGGALSFSLWVPGATPLSDISSRLAREMLDVPDPDAPQPHEMFGGPAGWMPPLRAAGFDGISLRAVDVPTRFGSSEEAVELLKRLAGDLSQYGDAAMIERYWQALADALPVQDGVLTARAAVVSATRNGTR